MSKRFWLDEAENGELVIIDNEKGGYITINDADVIDIVDLLNELNDENNKLCNFSLHDILDKKNKEIEELKNIINKQKEINIILNEMLKAYLNVGINIS